MFGNCEGLTELDLSRFDTSKVTHMGYMFQSCKSLKSLKLDSFDTTSVIDIPRMFENCISLKEFKILNHIQNIGEMHLIQLD